MLLSFVIFILYMYFSFNQDARYIYFFFRWVNQYFRIAAGARPCTAAILICSFKCHTLTLLNWKDGGNVTFRHWALHCAFFQSLLYCSLQSAFQIQNRGVTQSQKTHFVGKAGWSEAPAAIN